MQLIDTTVLIVEDEALVAMEIEKNLEKNGFDVVSNIAYGEKVLDEINLPSLPRFTNNFVLGL